MTEDLVKRLRDPEHPDPLDDLRNEAADRIEELERHIELRDLFLIENDLWEKFAKGAEWKK